MQTHVASWLHVHTSPTHVHFLFSYLSHEAGSQILNLNMKGELIALHFGSCALNLFAKEYGAHSFALHFAGTECISSECFEFFVSFRILPYKAPNVWSL